MNDLISFRTDQFINPISARIDAMYGLNIYVPDVVIYQEPDLDFSWLKIYEPNIKKIRSIIRKAKHHERTPNSKS